MVRDTVLAVLLTALILLLNANLRTMIGESETLWQDRLEMHEADFPFKLRPLTTLVTRTIAENTDLSVRDAFIVGQYPLLFIFLLSFALYLRQLGFAPRQRLLAIGLLAFSFPVLCLHFIPNYTWDDLWAYIGLTWMAVFLVRGRCYTAALCLALAAFSRESVLVVAPAFYFYRREKERSPNWLLAAGLSVAVYLLYRALLFPEVLPGRLSLLLVNFANAAEARQTLHSVFVSFGWLWVLAAVGIARALRTGCGEANSSIRKLALSALIVSPLCVFLTMTFSLARETRLFFTAFVFVVPLATRELIRLRSVSARFMERRPPWLVVGSAVALVTVCIGVTVLVFPSYPFLPMIDFHRVFFALHLAGAIVVVLAAGLQAKAS